MTANATHPGRVTIPGTDIGVRGTLVAEPQTENMLLALDDRLGLGPVKVDTDHDGVLQGGGLVVPIVASVLWLLRFEPHRHDVPPFSLGVYNLNTSGVPLEDLVAVTPLAIDETLALQIEAAAALGATNDTATASFVNDTASATTAALTGRVAGLRADRYLALDGVTPDHTALTALLATSAAQGVPVIMPAGKTAAIGGVVTLASGAHIVGEPGATLKATASTARLIDVTNSAANVTVSGLTFVGNGNTTAELLRIGNTSTRIVVERCAFTDTSTAFRGILVNSGASSDGVTIERNTFDGLFTPIQTAGSIDNLTIRGNRIKNWTQRGIYVVGNATDRTTNLVISGNRVSGLIGAGSSRYPIRVEGIDTNPHLDMTVTGNHVRGPGTGYTDPTTPGTADQIAIGPTDGLVLSGNYSLDGGDGGMTLGPQCKNVTISDNVIKRPWTAGLWLGSATTVTMRNVSITGNQFIDINMGAGVGAGAAGVRAQNCTGAGVVIQGNTFAADVGTNYTYGISVKGSDGFTIGPNTFKGINTTTLFDESGNTNLTVIPRPVSVLASGASVSNTTTDTTLFTAATIGPGSLVAGQTVVRLRLYGNMDSIATPGAFNMRVKVNGTVMLVSSLLASTATSTNTATPWSVDYDIVVDTLGASGAVSMFGKLSVVVGATNTRAIAETSVVGTTVNLTTGLTVSVSANTATANVGNIIRTLRGSVQQVS